MSTGRIEKRDGREVPFDEAKIAGAIAKAMAAVGEPDDGFSSEVAGVVRMTVDERHGAGSVPNIEEIQDLVEQALIELGRSRVAKAYILYRDQRARARAALHDVPRPGASGPGRGASGRSGKRGLPRVQVREAEGTAPWSKARIVAALMREADLSREVSEKVAARVEERVFAAGLSHVTTALVRELVEAELLSMGLESARRRQTSFGLPVYDLRRLMEAPPRSFDSGIPVSAEELADCGVASQVSGEVLRRFALQELLGDELSERHRSGDFHVHELSQPHRPLWMSIPAAALTSRADAEGAFDLIGELAGLAGGTVFGAVLEDPLPVLAPLASSRSLAPSAWLRAMTAAARGMRRRIDLSSPGLRSPNLLERLVRELGALAEDAFAPRLFLDERELAYLSDRDGLELDRLLASGRLVPCWSSGGERLVAPGCHRVSGERAAITCGAAVSINLPRIALRAGPWREDRVLELLAETVEDGLRAALALIAFRRGARRLGGRVTVALAPIGLREALQTTGDGALDPELGARLLGFLADALEQAERRHRVRLVLSPCFGSGVAQRFALADLRLPQHGQRLLFARPDEWGEHGELGGRAPASEQGGLSAAAGSSPRDHAHGDGSGAAGDPGRGADAPRQAGPYSVGYRLTAPARALTQSFDGWPLEARLTSTVAVGALTPLPVCAPGWAGGPAALTTLHFGGLPAVRGVDLPDGGLAAAVLRCFELRAEPSFTLLPDASDGGAPRPRASAPLRSAGSTGSGPAPSETRGPRRAATEPALFPESVPSETDTNP